MPLPYCAKCQSIIPLPLLTTETKRAVLLAVRSNQTFMAIKLIKDTSVSDLKDAKCVVDHINKVHGHCHNCSYTTLETEAGVCPVCNSFNFNWPDEVVY
ncbi:MAG: hypothetical protein QM534_06160 [Sediminibacterium sp.]|nr:hypothetical protein [Sediminibacterium sp.]